MAANYLQFHTSYKSLADDAKALVDAYQSKTITEEELMDALKAWDTNCPNLLYEDDSRNTLSKSVIRYLGKRRAVIVFTALKSLAH